MKRTLLLLLLLTLLCGCAQKPPAQTAAPETMPPVTTAPPETTAPSEPTLTPVETPCGTLYLPDQWDIPLTAATTLGEPMVILFSAEDAPLYVLTFSAFPDGAVGMVPMEDAPVYVGMTLFPLEEESDLLLSMQESVNTLLSQLPLEPLPEASAEGEDLLLLTPYGTLHFPVGWADCLQTRQPEENTLEFCCALPDREAVLLFTVTFGSDDGGIPASITAPDGTVTPLCLTVAEPEFDETWTPGEKDLYFAMQEDMNYLLAALS